MDSGFRQVVKFWSADHLGGEATSVAGMVKLQNLAAWRNPEFKQIDKLAAGRYIVVI